MVRQTELSQFKRILFVAHTLPHTNEMIICQRENQVDYKSVVRERERERETCINKMALKSENMALSHAVFSARKGNSQSDRRHACHAHISSYFNI